MTKICQKAWVEGKVQGVFYRASTQKQAMQLKLSGYAKNLSDGRVEVLACGEEENVIRLLNWLAIGPPQSRVDNVTAESVEYIELSEFEVL
jgi:acylphosphatase